MRDVVVEVFSKHLDLLDEEAVQNTVRKLDLCYNLMMRFRVRLMLVTSAFGTRTQWA